jgi:Acetyltransferases, including N-acetylases of ribosomal proteins
MELQANRLTIIPLNLKQFKLLLEGTDKMEEALNLAHSHESLDAHTYEAMFGLYKLATAHKEDYYWFTNWQIILKSQNISIGSACFMGCPNENGEVELGYGINEAFRCNGYMTEAVDAMCQWALAQPNVSCVIAETDKDNTASHRVLQKCGFTKYKETEEGYFWHMIEEIHK